VASVTSPSREARIPPHDLDAETSVLGAILLDQAAITRVLDFLHPEDFYRENNGHVYRAAQNLFREGEPIDNVTLAAELEKLGVLERVGGRAQLALLQESVPTAANVEYYARIVKDRAYKRRLITSGANVTALGYEESLDADEAVNKAQSEIYAISDDRVGGAMERLYDLLKPAMDRIDAQMASGGGVLGIASGFHDLDRMTNGYKPSDLVIIAGRPSMGKALALDTPIPTPTGWRTMQSLRVGDQVFDERGRACTVTFATPVMLGHRCYEVLLSDGEKLIADAEHQWSVRTRAARKRQGAAVVLTTEQMAGAVRLSTGRLNYSIPTCQPLEYPERELSLDPYVLGVWLGDGNTHGAVVTIGEPEVLTEPQAAGCAVRPRALREGKTPQVALSTGSRLGQNAKLTVSQVVAIRSAREAGQTLEAIATDYGVSAATIFGIVHRRSWLDVNSQSFVQVILRQLGVLGRKHIPRSYLEASVQQRVALLQGLMDTDGSIDGLGYAEFSVKCRELAEGALELVLGLGLKAKLAEGRSQLNGVDCGPRYRVQFLPGDFPICRIPSKAKRQRKVRPFARSRERRVAAIREVPSVPVRCIQVDSPNHLYLAGGACVPTHNTSFVLNVALNAAVEQKKPIAVFSLEMSKEQLVERMLCEQARIDAQRLHRGTLSDVEYERLAGALGPLGDAPIWIDDSPMLDDLTLRLKARQARAREGVEMIILDYLQLMHGRGRSDDNNRVQEVSAISRSLKSIARELKVPVIAISQLSRAPEARPDKRPILSDLRESGSIEQDADIVMFLYRDDYYNREKSEKPGIAEIIVAKHRNGPTGVVELVFRKELTRFENLERRRAAEAG
jgi:replicative DNA helicase